MEGTPSYPDPTSSAQADFALRLYFGPEPDFVKQCVRRAYLDLSRTAHGIEHAHEQRVHAAVKLREWIGALAASEVDWNQAGFDEWHRRVCLDLIQLVQAKDYTGFTIGQAQKWLNMSLKYIYIYGEERIPGYQKLYSYCHVPIDNIVMRSPTFRQHISFQGTWSRLDSYEPYLATQRRIREHFSPSSPLAVEFHDWLAQTQTVAAQPTRRKAVHRSAPVT